MKVKEKNKEWEPPFCYNPLNIPTLKLIHRIMNDRRFPVVPRGANRAMKCLTEYYTMMYCVNKLYQKIVFSQKHYPLDTVEYIAWINTLTKYPQTNFPASTVDAFAYANRFTEKILRKYMEVLDEE